MRRHRESIWTNFLTSAAVSVSIGIAAALASMFIFAAFTYYFMDSMEFSGFFGCAAISAGGFLGGYICGKFRRRKGLFEGLICGISIYTVISAASLIAAGMIPSIKKLLLLAVISAAGGVYGVNSGRPKHL